MLLYFSLLTLLTGLLAPGLQRERPSGNDELTLDSARPHHCLGFVLDEGRAGRDGANVDQCPLDFGGAVAWHRRVLAEGR